MKSKKKWIIVTVILLIITNSITFVFSNAGSIFLASKSLVLGVNQYEDYKSFGKMFYVEDLLSKFYYEDVDKDLLVEGAIKGMTNALNDPYTVFMNKDEYEEMNKMTTGYYTGIGVVMEFKDSKIYVSTVYDGSPAQGAGVLQGDIIEKVNGESVSNIKDNEISSKVMGEEGTDVTLTFYREGEGSIDLTMTRKNISIDPVESEMINDNIGYLRLSIFNENSSESFKTNLDDLNSKGMKGLILDLRGNPGGGLRECINIASNFIEKDKTVVSTIDNAGNENLYESNGGDYLKLPVVILIDANSASASEVLTGALRDYEKATLVGEKSFGKGIVQTIIETGDGTALKVTFSKYYTPSGENIHGIGIEPEYKVSYPEELLENQYSRAEDPQYNKALDLMKGILDK
ncbi:MAG: S41 family peptidase [Clostridiaceae bacterium]